MNVLHYLVCHMMSCQAQIVTLGLAALGGHVYYTSCLICCCSGIFVHVYIVII